MIFTWTSLKCFSKMHAAVVLYKIVFIKEEKKCEYLHAFFVLSSFSCVTFHEYKHPNLHVSVNSVQLSEILTRYINLRYTKIGMIEVSIRYAFVFLWGGKGTAFCKDTTVGSRFLQPYQPIRQCCQPQCHAEWRTTVYVALYLHLGQTYCHLCGSILRYFRFRFVHILIPADRFWSQLGVEILRKNVLKKFFSNTTCPEYFELVWNHPQVIYRLKFVKFMIPVVRVGPQLVAGVQC